MSANIPEHMLLSDLLKPTGYNCPENLQGKTFKEATAGDIPAELDDNKAVTIDVSTYTQPVEVTPTEGKEGMKKCTVTLENIPQQAKLYAFGTAEGVVYTFYVPEEDTAEIDVYQPSATSLVMIPGSYVKEGNKIKLFGATEYARYSEGDLPA